MISSKMPRGCIRTLHRTILIREWHVRLRLGMLETWRTKNKSCVLVLQNSVQFRNRSNTFSKKQGPNVLKQSPTEHNLTFANPIWLTWQSCRYHFIFSSLILCHRLVMNLVKKQPGPWVFCPTAMPTQSRRLGSLCLRPKLLVLRTLNVWSPGVWANGRLKMKVMNMNLQVDHSKLLLPKWNVELELHLGKNCLKMNLFIQDLWLTNRLAMSVLKENLLCPAMMKKRLMWNQQLFYRLGGLQYQPSKKLHFGGKGWTMKLPRNKNVYMTTPRGLRMPTMHEVAPRVSTNEMVLIQLDCKSCLMRQHAPVPSFAYRTIKVPTKTVVCVEHMIIYFTKTLFLHHPWGCKVPRRSASSSSWQPKS